MKLTTGYKKPIASSGTDALELSSNNSYLLLAGGGHKALSELVSSADLTAELSNYVTIGSNQTITGVKTFSLAIAADITGNADTLDGYHADDILPYGLENLCIGAVNSGGQTTLNSDGSITTSGNDADTFFFVRCTEDLKAGQIYTVGFYVTGVPSENTRTWEWPFAGQTNSNLVLRIKSNGWCWGTGTIPSDVAAGTDIIFDDGYRGFWNSINISKFIIVKGKQKAYYTPPISKMSVNYATSAGNADTCDGLHVHTGINNEANKIVRTDDNGCIQCGHINSYNGDEGNNSSPARVWGTNGSDSYLRTYLTSALSVGYAATAGNADTVNGYNITASNGKYFGKIPVIETDGVTELGRYIDFHYDTTTTSDYSTRLQVSGNHGNDVILPSASGTLALTSQIPTSLPANGGNANTADYAAYLRGRDGNGVYFGKETSSNIIAEWNTKSDNRWYLKAASTNQCRVEYADKVDWTGIDNKPFYFTPSSHTHTTSEITNFPTIGNGALHIKVNGTELTPEGGIFTANKGGDSTIDLTESLATRPEINTLGGRVDKIDTSIAELNTAIQVENPIDDSDEGDEETTESNNEPFTNKIGIITLNFWTKVKYTDLPVYDVWVNHVSNVVEPLGSVSFCYDIVLIIGVPDSIMSSVGFTLGSYKPFFIRGANVNNKVCGFDVRGNGNINTARATVTGGYMNLQCRLKLHGGDSGTGNDIMKKAADGNFDAYLCLRQTP